MLGLFLIPGPAVLLVLARSVTGGPRVGVATGFGIALGDLVHTAMATFGLSAVLMTSALAFSIVKYAGVIYLIVLGVRALFEKNDDLHLPAAQPVDPRRAFRQAIWAEMLNPKTALFFLAFLPQFVHPGHGSAVAQFATLGPDLRRDERGLHLAARARGGPDQPVDQAATGASGSGRAAWSARSTSRSASAWRFRSGALMSPLKPQASYDDFARLDIRIGKVVEVQPFRAPATRPTRSASTSAPSGSCGRARRSPITSQRRCSARGWCICNLGPKNIAGFTSELLILGAKDAGGKVIVLGPRSEVAIGEPIF